MRNFGLDNEKERVKEAVHLVELDPGLLDREPSSLSYGEKRKLAIASVISYKPDWIIFDEPFSGLDWQGKNAVKRVFKNLYGKAGIIIITHDMSPILDIMDRVVLMNRGTTIFSLPSDSIPWVEVENAGVDIPFHIKVAMFLKRDDIIKNIPLTFDDFVNEIKRIKDENRNIAV